MRSRGGAECAEEPVGSAAPRELVIRGSLGAVILFIALAPAGCDADPAGFEPASRISLERVAVLVDSTRDDLDGPPAGLGDAAPLGEDRIAFLDQKLNRIVVLDTSGQIVIRLGRKGGGPGEFGNPRLVMAIDSGIAVYDDLKLGLVNFAPDGQPRPDSPQMMVVGEVNGIVTGMVGLVDGSWVYSVRESSGNQVRESLYWRSRGATYRLASTPEAPDRWLRLPCGIAMKGGAPVFWPTLRWAATPTRVAYAATGSDRVVVWDVMRRDSAVIDGNAPLQRSTREAALAAISGYTVQTPARNCAIGVEQVLDQRGMAKTMPPIESIALSPNGALWVRLRPYDDNLAVVRVHQGETTDSLHSTVFPGQFLSPTRFVAHETDRNGFAVITLWKIQGLPDR
jgi:hypothetical protein